MSKTVTGTSVGKFSSMIRKQCPEYENTLPFTVLDMPVTCPKLDDKLEKVLGIKRHIYYIAIMNAVQLQLTGDDDIAFNGVTTPAILSGNTYLQEEAAAHKKGVLPGEYSAMPHIVYLAYLEHELNKIHPVLDQKRVLPGLLGSKLLTELVSSIVATLNMKRHMYCHPSLAGGYTQTISSGTIDFLVDDTLWIIRLRSQGPYAKLFYAHEHIPLLICAILIKRIGFYKDKPIRYLSCMSPLDGKFTRIDLQDIPPQLTDKLSQHIYQGPADTVAEILQKNVEPQEKVRYLERTERVKLVTAFVLTSDIFKEKQQIQYELETICGSSIKQTRIKNICRQILALYNKPQRLFDPLCQYNRERVILLNHLYYAINNQHCQRLRQPGLPDETITDIIKKASALYY